MAENRAKVGPLEDYLMKVADQASRYLLNPEMNEDQARCALEWLSSWAGASAMHQTVDNYQAKYQRNWMLAGLALSYVKVRSVATREQMDVIDAWMQQLADAAIDDASHWDGEHNNQDYWCALAVAVVGRITSEPAYVQWATHVFDQAMQDVRTDGALPAETDRGQLALHYHTFAAAPLVMLASILDRNDEPLDRLVAFVVHAMQDAAPLEVLAGAKQLSSREGAGDWFAVYWRQRERAADQLVSPTRQHVFDIRLGGSLEPANPLEHATR